MGYFFRRSSTFGPFRLNFSKSGIGASVGVKGARLTMTPRGTTYVTVGSHGFYYRETLSQRRRGSSGSFTPPAVLPVETRTSDDIVTAEVSDLVDSSSAALIERLNERAKMFNPARILYAIAAAMSVGALATLSTVQDSQDLPDATSPLSPARRSNARDEYSMLVVRYGESNSVLIAEPLGVVPVRTAHYSSAHVNVVLIPNECVEAHEYEVAQRSIAARSPKPAAGKGEMKNTIRCTPSLNYGWTIVGHIDSSENSVVSAEVAKVLLDRITVRQTSPPAVEVEKPAATKQRVSPRSLAKKQPEPKPEIQPNKQALLLEEQMSRNAKAAESRELYSKYALLFGSLGLFVAGIVAHKRNTEKRISRLFYELDETQRQRYGIVQVAMTHLAESNRVWRIEARSATSDWKRNAGASTLNLSATRASRRWPF
jgi:hypothetical protein